jgi:hypothetical protein
MVFCALGDYMMRSLAQFAHMFMVLDEDEGDPINPFHWETTDDEESSSEEEEEDEEEEEEDEQEDFEA